MDDTDMAQDTELDYLGNERDRAFERQQITWQSQDHAWQVRTSAREALNQARDQQQEAYEVQQRAWEYRRSAQDDTSQAYEDKQAAYDEQQQAWEELQRLRDSNGPRIGQLRDEHDDMFERIKSLSIDIDNAFSWGNKDDAFTMIEEVKQLRTDIRELPPQWRELSSYINDAKEVHSRASERFRPLQTEFLRLRSISDRAKAEHERARDEFKAAQASRARAQEAFEIAKAEHERCKNEFQEAKREADRCKDAFNARLTELRAEQQQRKDDKRSLAQQAGVPSQYWDDVWASTDDEGNVNLYFGGIGEPAGEDHGHYVMDVNGQVTYARDPGTAHGSHNFRRAQGNQWYTKARTDDETVHAMYDRDGFETIDYPHVHVIWDERRNEIRMHITWSEGQRSNHTKLPGDCSGNEVNAAIDKLRRLM